MIRTDAADEMLLRMLLRMTPGQTWDTLVMNGDDLTAGVKLGEGQLLYGLVRALCPEHVLEWGTGYGYSTIHLAAAVRDNNRIAKSERLWTIEINQERRWDAFENVRDAGLINYVEFTDTPPDCEWKWGFVLLDAGHTAAEVGAYLDYVRPRLEPHAVVAVHDGCWQNHAREAAGDDWNIIEMPTTSTGGLVLMTLKEAL